MHSTTPLNEAATEEQSGPRLSRRERERERERESMRRWRGWEEKNEKVTDAMRATWPLVGDPGRTGRRRRRKGECQTSGYVHSSPKKACYTTGTPIVLTGQRASFDSRLLSFPGSINLWPIPMEIFSRTTSSKRRGLLVAAYSTNENLVDLFAADDWLCDNQRNVCYECVKITNVIVRETWWNREIQFLWESKCDRNIAKNESRNMRK